MPIEKKNFERFMDNARVKATGASDAGIKAQFFDCATEFFNDSNAWQDHVQFQAVANERNYTIQPSGEGRIIRLAGVFDPNFIPQSALMPDIGQLTLQNPPNENQMFTVHFVKTVDLPVDKERVPLMPDALFKMYFLPLLDGVLGNLMNQENKTYANPKLAQYHLQRFRKGIAMARVYTQRANTSGAGSWRFPQAYASRGQRPGISVGNQTGF